MKRISRVALVSLALLVGLVAGGSAPAAADDGISASVSSFVSANTAMIAFGTVVAFGAAIFIPSIGQKNRTYLLVGGVVGAGALVMVSMASGGPNGTGGVEPPPNVAWNTRIATTYDTDVDTAAEVLDSEGFTACDGGSPDLDGAIATLATNGIIDQSRGVLSLQSDQDDDDFRGGSTGTAFAEIDCPLLPFSIALVGTIDVNGDGVDDSVTWKAKLQSMGPVTFSDGNLTVTSTIFRDGSDGWSCAFLTEGNLWVSAFGDAKMQLPHAPTSGPWIALGSHAGAGAAFDTGSFACVFETTQGAPVGYTIPPAAGNIEWSATILVGSETSFRELTVNWVLFTRD